MNNTINLQELADMPGVGSACEVLKQAGYWKEDAKDGVREFRVTVKGFVEHAQTLTVCANCASSAENKAIEATEHLFDDEDSIEVLDIHETGQPG